MKYFILLLMLVSSAFSQTRAHQDSLVLEQIFTMNGISWPQPTSSDFIIHWSPAAMDMQGNVTDSGINSLTIMHCNLDTIPSSISQLGLNHLNLTGNAIRNIPYSIKDMPGLVTIIMDSNDLTTIPSSTANMTWLMLISATHNKIVGFNGGNFVGNPNFKAALALSYNQIGCNPAWISKSQKAYIDAHDQNPDWYATQSCGSSEIALQTAPKAFKISYYPNPFTTMTTIRYDLPRVSNRVYLAIYDVTGALVNTLFDGTQGQGRFSVNFEGLRLGIYFSRVVVDGNVFTQKLLKVE